MIIFYDSLGVFGGSQTLILRMTAWLNKKNKRCAVLTEDTSNEETVSKLKSNNIEIMKIKGEKFNYISRCLNNIEENSKIISFTWNAYLDIEYVKHKKKLVVDNILYCIHVDTMKKGNGLSIKVLKQFISKLYKGILYDMIANNSLVMMDEYTQKETMEYNHLPDDIQLPIWRVPIYCEPIDDYEAIINRAYINNIIMTGGRAEFPFKGYILSLIDDFVLLCKKHSNISLRIVSDGPDVDKIIEKINSLELKEKSKINFCKWMPYEQFQNELKYCKLFVGMGTCILDASVLYKPAIAVRYNTMNNIASGLFSENVNELTASENCRNIAFEIMNNIMSCELKEYYKYSIEAFEKTKSVYDINQIMDQIINYKTQNGSSIMDSKRSILHFFYSKINYFRYRFAFKNDKRV